MPSRGMAYGCLALGMALTGSYVALSKPLAAALPVFLLAWLRFGIAAVAMLPWLRRGPAEPRMTGQVKRLVFLESFFGNFLFTICMVSGVRMTSAVSAGVIMASIPAVVALMSWAFLRERISLRIGAAIACGALGIGLLALSRSEPAAHGGVADSPGARDEMLGNLLVLGSVFCEAVYAVIGKKLTGSLAPKRISALINLWGLALMTPMGLYLALSFDFPAVHPGIWLLLVFYALAASMWTVWLWMTGLRTVPAAQAGVFMVLLPISAALVGVFVLGESFGGMQLLAFGIALLGVLLATLPQRTKSL
ncbi:EamA family transporter [Rhodoferax koreense]|uniref:EamA family transporter n=1 Tax=Rhodoferax koreensis TaxID=1842727 RepID=A0A1P8K3H0_9BURK|nr:EamA family transporter [Rhodoferax koreense]